MHKFLSHITAKILLVESGWLKQFPPPPPPTHTNTH